MKVKITVWTLASLSILYTLAGGAFALFIAHDSRASVFIERNGVALFDSTIAGDDLISVKNGYDVVLRHKEWRSGKSVYVVLINHRWSKFLLLPLLVPSREYEIQPKEL
jgi:hypothetical protein